MTKKNEWARIPSSWIQNNGLKPFSIRNCGVSIAALKVYLVLAFKYHDERKLNNCDGVKTSYDLICENAQLSRPLIKPALIMLQEECLIRYDKNQRGNTYFIQNYSRPGWAKIPISHWFEKEIFSHLDTRQHCTLYVLKLYFVILAFMKNHTQYTKLTYDSIEKYTNIPRKKIKSTINQLIHLKLIEFFQPNSYLDSEGKRKVEGSNTYKILGLPKERQGNIPLT